MVRKYYIDTSIWMDLYEDRKGYNNEPLGNFAYTLFLWISGKGGCITISDTVIKELTAYYTFSEIGGMMKPFEKYIDMCPTKNEQHKEAIKLAQERNIPPGDALHAILARDNGCILVTRDNDFRKLKDISAYYKPEQLI